MRGVRGWRDAYTKAMALARGGVDLFWFFASLVVTAPLFVSSLIALDWRSWVVRSLSKASRPGLIVAE